MLKQVKGLLSFQKKPNFLFGERFIFERKLSLQHLEEKANIYEMLCRAIY